MSIKRTFNGATIIKPGAYSKTVVQNLTGFPLQATGVVGIVGEAKGGEPGVIDILSKEGIQDAKTRYKSGPIADALGMLATPSGDPRIVNGASTIIVYKTNNGTQSGANIQNALAANIFTLASKNWGQDENNINYKISVGAVADEDAEIEGTVAGTYDLTGGGQTLILDINGVTHTFTNTLTGGAETVGDLIIELNDDTKWSPGNAPVTAALNTLGTGVKITLDPVVVASGELDYGYIKVDATSTIDTIVGITGENRGQKGSRVFTIKKDTLEEVSSEIGGTDSLTIKYVGAGTNCTMDIQDVASAKTLSTSVTGGPGGEDLSIVLKNALGESQLTIQALADQINALTAYEATAADPNPTRNSDELDYYDDLVIIDVAANLRADVFVTKEELDTYSTLVNATIVSNAVRAYSTVATPVFMTGATDGTSANSDFVSGFSAFESERINTVIPLISQDSGGLLIDSINAVAKAHVVSMWSTIGRSERNAYVSKNTDKAGIQDAAKTINSGYVSVVGQQIKVLAVDGTLKWFDPWAFACICAGLQSGSEVGEPITFKYMNINDIRIEDGSWDPKKDYSVMIDSGVTIGEKMDAGGFRVVLGNTTYGIDPNFVWNRISVVEAAGYVAYDLRFNLEAVFTGNKARTGTAEAIKNFIMSRMAVYLDADIIVGDDLNDGLGYKDLSVSVEGATAIINSSVTPVQGIDFLLSTLYLADIRQSA